MFCSRVHRRGFHSLAIVAANAAVNNVSTSIGDRSIVIHNCIDTICIQVTQVCIY